MLRHLGYTAALALVALGSMIGSVGAYAQGKEVPSAVTMNGDELVLNGAGFRSLMGMKMYEAGLYLDKKSQDADAILASDSPQLIRMHIMSGMITAARVEDVVLSGFKATRTYEQYRDEVSLLLKAFAKDVKKGDYYDLYYEPGVGLRAYLNGEETVLVPSDVGFKSALYGIWLSDTPVQRRLKKKMLGTKKRTKKRAS